MVTLNQSLLFVISSVVVMLTGCSLDWIHSSSSTVPLANGSRRELEILSSLQLGELGRPAAEMTSERGNSVSDEVVSMQGHETLTVFVDMLSWHGPDEPYEIVYADVLRQLRPYGV